MWRINYRHGMYKTKVYAAWLSMLNRCNNPRATRYSYYGGRGVKVCKRWRKFENFFEDMGQPPTKGHSLDRINNNGNYEAKNCRWATRSEQMKNRRPFSRKRKDTCKS